MTRRAVTYAVVCLACCLSGGTYGRGAQITETIDFETGYSRLDPVETINTQNNTLRVSTSSGEVMYIADVDVPKDAFEVVGDEGLTFDIPTGGDAGQYFLTDGPTGTNNFLFQFAVPVLSFDIDIYDFRGDGGAKTTDFVVLHAFSDPDWTNEVDSQRYIIPIPPPVDGAVQTLSVSAARIQSLTMDFSTFDRGTGLDNIRFTTIPEPSTGFLVVLGGLLLWARRRHT